MYAIIETGGKQYRVSEGDALKVEKRNAEIGSTVEVDRVLALKDDNGFKIGRPYIDGAKVLLKVNDHGKGKKILVFRYKAKKNVRVRYGHRQPFTAVTVEKIEA